MEFDYSHLSLGAIHEDLLGTVSDLVVNAGDNLLEPTLDMLENTKVNKERPASPRLVAYMQALQALDEFLRCKPAHELMRAAAEEINRLNK